MFRKRSRWLRPLLLDFFASFYAIIFWVGAASAGVRPELAAKREWRKIEIAGAVCGDGQPYSIFISAGDPRKIAFDVMGGGACWSAATCYGLPDTWIHPIPQVWEPGGFISSDPARSVVSNHTIVYFPYCTGDVHLGTHQASYLPGKAFHHEGALNFAAALKRVVDGPEIDLASAEQFTMMGYSAGALGALFHVFEVEPYVRHVKDKVLIADAPGLHFGDKFWDKFTPALFRDFASAVSRVGITIHRGDGNLSDLVPRVCRALPDWRVGVLQGSRDLVMSKVFGAISPDDHEKLIYSERGVYTKTADAHDNCSAWVPRTEMHTFLAADESGAIQASTGESAVDYVRNLVLGVWGERDHPYMAGPNFK